MNQYEECRLCPRKCRVNRLEGQRGICGQTAKLRVARTSLHMWEEPCLSGTRGSGTVFFSGCNLHCVYCQNRKIAMGNLGKEMDEGYLAELFLRLQEKGANNINLVTGAHFAPGIIKAIECAKRDGLNIPIVYNSSGYEEIETIKMLDGYVDIFMPDLKYVDRKLSQKYSNAEDYFEVASRAIEEMVKQVGDCVFTDEEKHSEKIDAKTYQNLSEEKVLVMTKGVIVRHLLLPGCKDDSAEIISYLLKKYGEKIFISIMNQYTPVGDLEGFPELSQRVNQREYDYVLDAAIENGIENGFMQEGDSAQESFIPDFKENDFI